MTRGSGNHIVDEKDRENGLDNFDEGYEEAVKDFENEFPDYAEDAFNLLDDKLTAFIQARDELADAIMNACDAKYDHPKPVTKSQKDRAEVFEMDYETMVDQIDQEFAPADVDMSKSIDLMKELVEDYGRARIEAQYRI